MRNSTDKKGIYIIPCIDCTQVYVGETGRSLDIRMVEHKRACRLGYENSAVANHTLNIGHRINFNKAAIICENNNISHRRVIEGALINKLDTFIDNKSFSQEDIISSHLICKAAKLDMTLLENIAPQAAHTLSNIVSSSLRYQRRPYEQDDEHPQVPPLRPHHQHANNILAINDEQPDHPMQLPIQPSPPPDRPSDRQLRRSARLLNRLETNIITS